MTRASAIILTHDRLPMLRRAVASARWQTHGDLEIVVVANGTGPDTTAWLAGLDDPRIRVVTLEQNIAPSAARNAGLAAATGEWVGFLDDDDLWAPDKVQAMVAEGQRTGRDWVYCGTVYVEPDGAVVAGRPPLPQAQLVELLPVAYTVPAGLSGVMFRPAALPDGGRIDEGMSYCTDWDLTLRLLAQGPPAGVSRPLVAYRQHPGAWSRGVDDQRHEFDVIEQRHAALRGGRKVHRGEHHRYVAAQAARTGDRAEALRHYVQAIVRRDGRSLPRMLGAMLPAPVQRWARLTFLSDRGWVDEGRTWVAALHLQP